MILITGDAEGTGMVVDQVIVFPAHRSYSTYEDLQFFRIRADAVVVVSIA